MPNSGVAFDSALDGGATPGLANASLAGVPFRLNPDSVQLSFRVKTTTIPTVGGLVVQVFGVEFGDLVVSGSFGAGGWREQRDFFNRIVQLVQAQGTQPISAPQPEPVRFYFPSRGYDFLVYIKDFQSRDGMAVVHDNQVINPSWTLTLFIETDQSPGSLTKVLVDDYISRLSDGLGYVINGFNGPMTSADVQQFVQSQGYSSVDQYINSGAFGGPVQTPSSVSSSSPTGTVNGVTPTPPPPNVSVTSSTDFATFVLQSLGAPTNAQNMKDMVAWCAKESHFGSGGNDDPLVTRNPLNCSVNLPGSSSIGGGSNVQRYATWTDGIQATVDTLTGPRHYYDSIVSSLIAGTGIGADCGSALLKWSGGGYSSV